MRRRCKNPECRNFKYSSHKKLCPECRGIAAIKYELNPNIVFRRSKLVVMKYDPCMPNDDHDELSQMYKKAKPIGIRSFLKHVPLAYVNAYFGYKSAKSKGMMFKDDDKLRFFESRYYECHVLCLEKDNLHYVFAQPLAFAAAIMFHELNQSVNMPPIQTNAMTIRMDEHSYLIV